MALTTAIGAFVLLSSTLGDDVSGFVSSVLSHMAALWQPPALVAFALVAATAYIYRGFKSAAAQGKTKEWAGNWLQSVGSQALVSQLDTVRLLVQGQKCLWKTWCRRRAEIGRLGGQLCDAWGIS